ncbi:MAG: T6SS phospholipase effector Tle1-like catalytic domain-containing protein [Paracoccus sp. (in: a-proteobacteria)]
MNALAGIDAAASGAAGRAGLRGETGNIAQTCPKVTLELGMFFDGTLNNRFNVLSQNKLEGSDSYQNALSNPALLHARYKNSAEFDEPNTSGGTSRAFRSVYVEGPGSTRGKEDDNSGYAFGMGRQSGVEARVLWGFRQMLRQIGLFGGAGQMKKLVLDVFGFSRGAAAARYFVNCVRAGEIRYDPYGPGDYTEKLPKSLKVEIRFLGIFDTVAAIGDPADDDNDPVNVHLNTAQVTGQIYHLTAGDEYRRNFRLNRNVPGGGSTLQLPGAHSDVGGGYRDPGDSAKMSGVRRRFFGTRAAAEEARQAALRRDREPGAYAKEERVYVNEGWLEAHDTEGGFRRTISPVTKTITPGSPMMPPRTVYAYDEQLYLERPWVEVGLSRIALHMMHEAASKHVNGALKALPANDPNYVIPDGLKRYEAAIRAGSLSGAARRAVLRKYGHVSAKDSSVTDTDWIGHMAESDHIRVEYPNKPGKAR